MSQKQHAGFTLVEAVVAIAVVVILSGIVTPLVVKNVRDSQMSRAKNDVQVIAAAIAKQLADTGTIRPYANATGNRGNATGQVAWHSGVAAGRAPTGLTLRTNNTFANLFTPNKTDIYANRLFGATPGQERSYRGPYLSSDVTLRLDPWGRSYVILGYSATNNTSRGPIWVVSAGPDNRINTTNRATSVIWSNATYSADDIVIRVN